ncbi:hypothetical protein V498_08315, partial [Pseudogymnoascus sp. VKM F-4517 (FW-2822)]
MAEVTDWKAGLSATVRFENVENIQKGIEAAGEPSKARAQRAAFAAETEAYKDSHSLLLLRNYVSYQTSPALSLVEVSFVLLYQPKMERGHRFRLFYAINGREGIGFVCFTPSLLNNECGASV